ncbi:hypothetical protein AB4Z52_13625 [Rhizobium sp. 2YAF20]|uniref:hypothetical protein n=1 Tax=Rhizobium sp. 2YAF20 TaxID=3233027 RepID=UPI003F9C6AB7
MAKITSKIRVGDYSVSENKFDIHFQLRPASVGGPEFTLIYNEKLLSMPDETRFWLGGLGLTLDDMHDAFDEVLEWLDRPRAKFGGQSSDQMMWRRIELTIQSVGAHEAAEKERRGKVEAERIIIAAPGLDWAMSAVDELEGEIAVVGGDVQKNDETVTVTLKFGGIEAPATMSQSEFENLTSCDWATPKRRSYTVQEIEELVEAVAGKEIKLARNLGLNVDEPGVIEKMQQSYSEARATAMIGAMEAGSFGEDAPQDPDKPIIDMIMGRLSRELGILAEKVKPTQEIGMRTAIRAGLVKYDRERAQARKTIIDEAVNKAVGAIHEQVRRFVSPMSYREHQFLRDVVRDEIAKVVGSSL